MPRRNRSRGSPGLRHPLVVLLRSRASTNYSASRMRRRRQAPRTRVLRRRSRIRTPHRLRCIRALHRCRPRCTRPSRTRSIRTRSWRTQLLMGIRTWRLSTLRLRCIQRRRCPPGIRPASGRPPPQLKFRRIRCSPRIPMPGMRSGPAAARFASPLPPQRPSPSTVRSTATRPSAFPALEPLRADSTTSSPAWPTTMMTPPRTTVGRRGTLALPVARSRPAPSARRRRPPNRRGRCADARRRPFRPHRARRMLRRSADPTTSRPSSPQLPGLRRPLVQRPRSLPSPALLPCAAVRRRSTLVPSRPSTLLLLRLQTRSPLHDSGSARTPSREHATCRVIARCPARHRSPVPRPSPNRSTSRPLQGRPAVGARRRASRPRRRQRGIIPTDHPRPGEAPATAPRTPPRRDAAARAPSHDRRPLRGEHPPLRHEPGHVGRA